MKDFINEFENLLKNQVAFKAEIVEQDERESSARGDAKSRKILNFGHTLAHALEKVTDYKLQTRRSRRLRNFICRRIVEIA
jgi:3-dehydroquinate synthetase